MRTQKSELRCEFLTADYISFTTNSIESIIKIDKIWLQPKTNEDSNWSSVLNNAIVRVFIYKNPNTVDQVKTYYDVDIKVDPYQKQPCIELNHVIKYDDTIFKNDTSSNYLIEVVFKLKLGLGIYNALLQLSYDENTVLLVDYNKSLNEMATNQISDQLSNYLRTRKIKTYLKLESSSTAPFESHHFLIYTCNSLLYNHINESDVPYELLTQLKETAYYKRVFEIK
jgi:hypothetical protein